MRDLQVNGGRVRYAGNGTVRLAYRVFGEAENTVVWTPGAARNVESFDDPASPFATLVKQLSQVTRLVVWDMRGGGLSDAATEVSPLTERIEDLVPATPSASSRRQCSASARAVQRVCCSRPPTLNGSVRSSCTAQQHDFLKSFQLFRGA